MEQMQKLSRQAALVVTFLWFMSGGIAHFTHTGFFISLLPGDALWMREAILLSGAVEILLALMLLSSRVRPLAGWGLIAVTLTVLPVNTWMWLNPDQYPDIRPWVLDLRLVIQLLLPGIIWWGTRRVERPMPAPRARASRAH